MRIFKISLLLILSALMCQCTDESLDPNRITLYEASINGTELQNGHNNIKPDVQLMFVFSEIIRQEEFKKAFSFETSNGEKVDYKIEFLNQSSKVIIKAQLQPSTQYKISINNTPISLDEEALENTYIVEFKTTNPNTSTRPCISSTNDCLSDIEIENHKLEFFTSFSLEDDETNELIHNAVIVIHGANRNADDYFNYFMTALTKIQKENQTVLIAPSFKSEEEAESDQHYWENNSWREGRLSRNSGISSFRLVDELINRLFDNDRFPNLKNVIITGHSSGGLFTDVYAISNQSHNNFSNVNFDYIVANSQYFYYPDGQRIDENTNTLYTPTDCTGYDIWPQGFSVVPSYLESLSKEEVNQQMINRNITFMLGNGNQADPSLNTTDCSATLLGSTRFKRGENMVKYLSLLYPNNENFNSIIIDGVGHDGKAMYDSQEFKTYLVDLID